MEKQIKKALFCSYSKGFSYNMNNHINIYYDVLKLPAYSVLPARATAAALFGAPNFPYIELA